MEQLDLKWFDEQKSRLYEQAEAYIRKAIKEYGDTSEYDVPYIAGEDMSDDALYLACGFEPKWDESIDDEVTYPVEIESIFLSDDEKVFIVTFECGEIAFKDLSIDDVLRLVKYVSYV